MSRTILGPIFILSGLGGIVALMAETNMFNPMIIFIHSDAITPLQASACIMFAALGFAACYFFLNMLCTYFVPRMDVTMGRSHDISRKDMTQRSNKKRI